MSVLILGIPIFIGFIVACVGEWWKWNVEQADKKREAATAGTATTSKEHIDFKEIISECETICNTLL